MSDRYRPGYDTRRNYHHERDNGRRYGSGYRDGYRLDHYNHGFGYGSHDAYVNAYDRHAYHDSYDSRYHSTRRYASSSSHSYRPYSSNYHHQDHRSSYQRDHRTRREYESEAYEEDSERPRKHKYPPPNAPRSRTPFVLPPSLTSRRPPSSPTSASAEKHVDDPTSSTIELPTPKPSSSYLTLAEQPSISGPPSSHPRKLLILDLNGTLLYRKYIDPGQPIPESTPTNNASESSQHEATYEEKYHSKKRHRYARDDADNKPRRVAHLRPHMPTFRAYLFHPQTRAWLDTMIWSSAQPQNVAWMVRAAFDIPPSPTSPSPPLGDKGPEHQLNLKEGENTEAKLDEGKGVEHYLRAIWARDTLGLAKSSYSSKVQTYKDLNIVWDNLDYGTPSSSSSSISLPSESHSSNPSPHPVGGIPYSTPALQALFHIPHRQPRQGDETSHDSSIEPHSARTTILVDDSTTKAAFQPYNHVCVSEYTPSSSRPEEVPKAGEDRDDTLLAVIGVLDALKDQSSVPGWIRSRGLWLNGPGQATSGATDEKGADGIGENFNEGSQTQWFEDPQVFQSWVHRGRNAVQDLGLSVE